MPSEKRKFGDIGESIAEDYLKKKGYKIIESNYRLKNLGEIDLICQNTNRLHFVEVKTRDVKHETNFPIQLSVRPRKKKILRKICEIYLIEKEKQNMEWQVDAVYVKFDSSTDSYSIEHLENILWEEYY